MRTSVTSRYHGSKNSGSEQPYLIETAIRIEEQWKPNYGLPFFVLSVVMQWKVLNVNFFFCHICRTTVCRDPEILLP